MVKIFIAIFLVILTLTSGWRTRRYVKSGPLWLGDFKDVLSSNWNKNMRPLQKLEESTYVLNVDDALNIDIPSTPENNIKENEENIYRESSDALRMCPIRVCGKKNKFENEHVPNKKNNSQGKKICTCSKAKNRKICKCGLLRAESNMKRYSCHCGVFDNTCKLICQQRKEKTAVLKLKRCGCGRNDYTCLEKCFNKENLQCRCSKTDIICQEKCFQEEEFNKQTFLLCGCGKTDRMCHERCLNRDYFTLRTFLRCGCGKTDLICQSRCFDRGDSSLQSFLKCGCAKTDRMCQDRCLNDDDSALHSFLQCGCAKNDRTCQKRCFQINIAAIQNRLRCGCNVTEFSCLDRCARDRIPVRDSTFSNCGCNSNDYACRLRCDRNVNGWRKPNSRLCECENYDRDCQERCAQDKKGKDTFDNLIAHVMNYGKRYKINNDIDAVVYDPLNFARILNDIKFNSNTIRDKQGEHVPLALKFDGNVSINKQFQPVTKPVTKVDGNERANKEKRQKIDQVLKELQNAEKVVFDTENVQSDYNEKSQSAKPIKFIDLVREFAINIKNGTSIKLSNSAHIKASIANKSTKKDKQKKASSFRNFSLQEPKKVRSQKKHEESLDHLYKIVRSSPSRKVERRNKNHDDDNLKENRNGGMDFANDVIESLQDYLYARRKNREKRLIDDDHDFHHPHPKHRLLPLTKKQKTKRLTGQVSRSLIKFRRNLPGAKVETYGAPFELDIKGMGQVNFVKAVQLLNV